jgi:ectoine/hydroxyectoine ABC transporter solute-binding protein
MIDRRDFLGYAGALSITTLAGTAALLSACGGGSTAPSAQSTLDRLRAQKYLSFGFSNFAPYSYVDSKGVVTGEAVEVARTIMKSLGVPDLQGVVSGLDTIIPGLQARRFDAIAAGIFITPARCGQVIFSDPDYLSLAAFIVRKNNPLHLNTLQDVTSSVKVGMAPNSSYLQLCLDAGIDRAQISFYPDAISGANAVQAGRTDGHLATAFQNRDTLSKLNVDSIELGKAFTPVVKGQTKVGAGGYAFRKEDVGFRDAFNSKLTELKTSGAIVPIIRPFGFTADDVAPPDVTAAKLCAG